MGPKSIFFQ